MDKNTEREIAQGLQQGSRQAWLQLYEAYCEPVWRNISRLMGGDSAAVSDLVQETRARHGLSIPIAARSGYGSGQ